MRFLILTVMFAGVLAHAQYMRGVNLSEAEWGNLPGNYGTGYTYGSAPTFDYFAARHLNFIREEVKWERLQPTLGGELDQAQLGYLKQDIAWAKAAGAVVSINLQNYGRYSIGLGGVYSDPYAIDNVYNGAVQVSSDNLADFWAKMSNEFKDEPTVYAYDMMNEPHDMGTANWNTISQKVLSAVRANGDMKVVMVPGDSWSNATAWSMVNGSPAWISDPANNYFYEAHEYFDSDYSGSYANSYDWELARNPSLATIGVDRFTPFKEWCTNNNVPCYVGEYGIPNTDSRWYTVLDNFLKALDAAGYSGTYWAAGEWWANDQGGDYPLSVQPSNNFTTDKPQMSVLVAHLAPKAFRTISAAASWGYSSAPGQLVAGYGDALAPGDEQATLPLPESLQGTMVQITDANGTVSKAPLLYVSKTQINYQAPAGIAAGRADVSVISNSQVVGSGVLEVQPEAPTLFSANQNGDGVASAQVAYAGANNSVMYTTAAHYDKGQGRWVPTPITFSGGGEVVLVLYGTGFDRLSGKSGVAVTIGSTPVQVTFAGKQNQYVGLDQINVKLPSSLAGSGEVPVLVTVDGFPANPVTVEFQ